MYPRNATIWCTCLVFTSDFPSSERESDSEQHKHAPGNGFDHGPDRRAADERAHRVQRERRDSEPDRSHDDEESREQQEARGETRARIDELRQKREEGHRHLRIEDVGQNATKTMTRTEIEHVSRKEGSGDLSLRSLPCGSVQMVSRGAALSLRDYRHRARSAPQMIN